MTNIVTYILSFYARRDTRDSPGANHPKIITKTHHEDPYPTHITRVRRLLSQYWASAYLIRYDRPPQRTLKTWCMTSMVTGRPCHCIRSCRSSLRRPDIVPTPPSTGSWGDKWMLLLRNKLCVERNDRVLSSVAIHWRLDDGFKQVIDPCNRSESVAFKVPRKTDC